MDAALSPETAALIRRLSRLYQTLSRTNSAIARAESAPALLEEICRIAVEHGGFVLAAVGLIGPDGRVRSRAAAGPGADYASDLDMSIDEHDAAGSGPGGRALRSGRSVICNDFQADPRNAPWRDRARLYGIRASAAIPLNHNGELLGLLSVYASIPGEFGPQEVALLEDMGTDIAMGLANVERSQALRRTSEQRERLLDELRQIERAVRAGVMRITLPDWTLWWSGGLPPLLGLPPEAALAWASLETALGASGVATLRSVILGALEFGETLEIDLPLPRGAPGSSWIRVSGRIESRQPGNSEVSAIVQDVSELHLLTSQVEEATMSERTRIVHELHDSLGQILTGAALLASAHERDVRAQSPALAGEAGEIVVALKESQRLCRDLAHGALEDLDAGVARALQRLAERTSASGITTTLSGPAELIDALPRHQSRELYRIVQEALTNALKHSGCHRIGIEIAARGAMLELIIRDDGRGFRPEESKEGIGLRSMRFRAGRIGATVTVESALAGGTEVRVLSPRLGAQHVPGGPGAEPAERLRSGSQEKNAGLRGQPGVRVTPVS